MINKQQMETYLKEGMSTGDISKLTGVSRSQIGYLIQKYNAAMEPAYHISSSPDLTEILNF